MSVLPSASYSITVRLEIRNRPGMLGRVASAIGNAGGDIGAVDLVESHPRHIVRDFTIKARDSVHGQQIVSRLKGVAGTRVINVLDRTFLIHRGGKIEIRNKTPIRTRDDLSMAYTPGVARVCLAIREDRERAFALTIKQNSVAVITDGTAVLGLGDIGPEAALPVMEGKAMLFKEFGGVDAFPLCLATKDVDRIVETVEALAPAFGGINLEDIAAPRCFTDADGATPIAELKRLEPLLAGGADLAIGSRVVDGPGVTVGARRHQVVAGRVFNWIVGRLGLCGVADSQCGFKAFTAAAAEDLFRRTRTDGFGFDVELLLRAGRAGYRIEEVAVNWSDQPGSKSSVLRDGPRMLREILVARARLRREP